jgi:hypothetical protein
MPADSSQPRHPGNELLTIAVKDGSQISLWKQDLLRFRRSRA